MNDLPEITNMNSLNVGHCFDDFSRTRVFDSEDNNKYGKDADPKTYDINEFDEFEWASGENQVQEDKKTVRWSL